MNTTQTTATAAAVIVLTIAVTAIVIVRIAVRDSTPAQRPQILASIAGLIRAILGLK